MADNERDVRAFFFTEPDVYTGSFHRNVYLPALTGIYHDQEAFERGDKPVVELVDGVQSIMLATAVGGVGPVVFTTKAVLLAALSGGNERICTFMYAWPPGTTNPVFTVTSIQLTLMRLIDILSDANEQFAGDDLYTLHESIYVLDGRHVLSSILLSDAILPE